MVSPYTWVHWELCKSFSLFKLLMILCNCPHLLTSVDQNVNSNFILNSNISKHWCNSNGTQCTEQSCKKVSFYKMWTIIISGSLFLWFCRKDGWKLSSPKTNMLWCNCSVHSLSEFFVTTVKVWQCNWKKTCIWVWKWAWSKCNVDLLWRKIWMANYKLCQLCHGWETGKCTLVSYC